MINPNLIEDLKKEKGKKGKRKKRIAYEIESTYPDGNVGGGK